MGKGFDLQHPLGDAERFQRLAARHADLVENSEVLTFLLPFLVFGAAQGREEYLFVVQPGEGALLPKSRELKAFSALEIAEPEVRAVAILLPIRFMHCEAGKMSAGAVLDLG